MRSSAVIKMYVFIVLNLMVKKNELTNADSMYFLVSSTIDINEGKK